MSGRCTVQLGVYDGGSMTLKNLGSGAILSGGRVLTCAHNLLDVHHSQAPYAPLVTAGRTVLVGAFVSDDQHARWRYTARVLTPLPVLQEMHGRTLLDLALLQITGEVECHPPFCLGKTAVEGAQQIQVVRERPAPATSFDRVPYLRCDPRCSLRAGETDVAIISFAAAEDDCIHVSRSQVVNLANGFLQTTAFVSMGSSGGPVINAAGDIVSVVLGGGDVRGGVVAHAKTRVVKYLRPDHAGAQSQRFSL
eukprot:g7425.t1